MPNIGGPDERERRLYAGVIRSMALYGAPVSVEELMDRNGISHHHALGARRTGGTPTDEPAGGSTSAHLWAPAPLPRREPRSRIVGTRRNRRKEVGDPAVRPDEVAGPTAQAGQQPHRAVRPIIPVLEDWMRSRSKRTFRLTQVLSGDGCVGEYLHMIWKEATPGWWHCEAEVDSVLHTLEQCPALTPVKWSSSGS
ncbi:uncharacterized protein LOC143221532 [Lasioglossum baleicum]|uniref:uncharacterized protein LOC143221532 n=1 Tax=Lasioglossum baleicum TaxID=434251 RepID=UPI003FCCC891